VVVDEVVELVVEEVVVVSSLFSSFSQENKIKLPIVINAKNGNNLIFIKQDLKFKMQKYSLNSNDLLQ
jgi:hypothetical protein